MNTYTIHALTITDAALVKLAADAVAGYDQREGMTRENSLDGTWDMTQGAKLAEHLRSMLDLIEGMTRPADRPLLSLNRDQLSARVQDGEPAAVAEWRNREQGETVVVCRTCGFVDCLTVTSGETDCPRWPAREPGPVERVTGTGWPA